MWSGALGLNHTIHDQVQRTINDCLKNINQSCFCPARRANANPLRYASTKKFTKFHYVFGPPKCSVWFQSVLGDSLVLPGPLFRKSISQEILRLKCLLFSVIIGRTLHMFPQRRLGAGARQSIKHGSPSRRGGRSRGSGKKWNFYPMSMKKRCLLYKP